LWPGRRQPAQQREVAGLAMRASARRRLGAGVTRRTPLVLSMAVTGRAAASLIRRPQP